MARNGTANRLSETVTTEKPRGKEDLTGQVFGELTVLRRAEEKKNNHLCWVCRCICGKECVVAASRLKNGHTKSCGCARRRTAANRRDLTGQRFGRLTALYPLEEKDASGKVVWRCRCDCGNETVVAVGSLVRGLTKSCGCLRQEVSSGMHDHMHYRDDTCVEMLERAQRSYTENKSGFRGLFLTKDGLYRATITFRKVHYHLGYFRDFDDAVKARLNAEQQLHAGYVEAYRQYQEKAEQNPAWAEENPFYYNVRLVNGEFSVSKTRL